MRKSASKSLQLQTKSLFKFKNNNGKSTFQAYPTTGQDTDPTLTTTTVITW